MAISSVASATSPHRTGIFLIDSLPSSGLGHARRSLALGQALVRLGCDIQYLLLKGSCPELFEETGAHPSIISEEKIIDTLLKMTKEYKNCLLLIDTYLLSKNCYQNIAKRLPSLPVMAFDDYGEKIGLPLLGVINSGLGAEQIPYPGRFRYYSAIGPQYMPLPKSCLQTTPHPFLPHPRQPLCPRIFLVMGASDPEEQTCHLTRLLLSTDLSFILHVVAGPYFGPTDTLEALCASDSRACLHINPHNFHELAANCHLAITGAGTTVAEFCYLQVPVAALVLADNQEPTANTLQQQGVGVHLGRFDQNNDEELLQKILTTISRLDILGTMAAKGRSLVDGKGTARLAAHVLSVGERYAGRTCSVINSISNDIQ